MILDAMKTNVGEQTNMSRLSPDRCTWTFWWENFQLETLEIYTFFTTYFITTSNSHRESHPWKLLLRNSFSSTNIWKKQSFNFALIKGEVVGVSDDVAAIFQQLHPLQVHAVLQLSPKILIGDFPRIQLLVVVNSCADWNE